MAATCPLGKPHGVLSDFMSRRRSQVSQRCLCMVLTVVVTDSILSAAAPMTAHLLYWTDTLCDLWAPSSIKASFVTLTTLPTPNTGPCSAPFGMIRQERRIPITFWSVAPYRANRLCMSSYAPSSTGMSLASIRLGLLRVNDSIFAGCCSTCRHYPLMISVISMAFNCPLFRKLPLQQASLQTKTRPSIPFEKPFRPCTLQGSSAFCSSSY